MIKIEQLHQTAAWVSLEARYGDETTIVDSARLSKSGRRIVDFCQRDTDLLYELVKNGHGTCFEHVVFRFHVSAPIFVLRQWMRHRIGTFNEYSQRYREPIREYYTPPELLNNNKYTMLMKEYFDQYDNILYDLTQNGKPRSRAREVARCCVPVSVFSEIVWTVNLRSLMNFLDKRNHPHAQYEILLYAKEIDNIVKSELPVFHQQWMKVKNT